MRDNARLLAHAALSAEPQRHARRSPILLPLSLATECFCAKCDALIHARKKNKTHVREAIEVVEPEPEPVPCDSDPAHVAVMYCEDCEENFCAGQ